VKEAPVMPHFVANVAHVSLATTTIVEQSPRACKCAVTTSEAKVVVLLVVLLVGME
jgi:hypothetical protein